MSEQAQPMDTQHQYPTPAIQLWIVWIIDEDIVEVGIWNETYGHYDKIIR